MMLKSKLRRLLTAHRYRRQQRGALLVLAFVVVGAGILIISHAATPTASVEAEAGTNSANAQDQAGNGSSANGYVKFTAAPTTPTIGAPSDVGITPGTTLKTWTGSKTITPTTAGVVNGVVDGYLFTSGPIYVSGNVTISNSKFAFSAQNLVIVQGTTSPGPLFSHIEVDGNLYNHPCSNNFCDNMGVTNSTHDSGNGGSFTLDHSHLYNLNNGLRLDSNSKVTNTLIDKLKQDSGSHVDGVEIYCGSNITMDHTTIDATASSGFFSSAIETQNDFCPVSNVSYDSNLFSGGTATFRISDSATQVTHISVKNVTIVTKSYQYFAVSDALPSNIDTWLNVKTSNGTTIPKPTGTNWTWDECVGVSVPGGASCDNSN